MRWMFSGIGVAALALALAAVLWFATESSLRGDGPAAYEHTRSPFRAPVSAPLVLDDDYPRKPFDMQKRMARRLLQLSPAALREQIEGMDDPVAMAFRIAVKGLAEDDINRHSDTTLLEFQMVMWLAKVGSKEKCAAWMQTIADPEVRALSAEAISGP